MIHKEKALQFIAYIVELERNGELEWIRDRYVDYSNELFALVRSSISPDEIYLNFGKNMSVIDDGCNFNNFFYREEVFEYLLENGYSKDAAFDLTTHIRKGKYGNKKLPVSVDESTEDFCSWAAKVKFLPSRKFIFECMYPLNDKFEFLFCE